MLNVILGVLSFNAILIVFKYLKKYNVDNLQALFYNYLVAGTCGAIYSADIFSLKNLISSDFSMFGIFIGILFISSFLFLAIASQRLGMGVATTANKMSVIFPIIGALLFLKEPLTAQKIIGITFALVAVYFVTKTKKSDVKFSFTNLWILIFIFVGQGIADTLFNFAQSWYVRGVEKGLFFTCIFLSAAFFGGIFAVFQIRSGKINFQLKAIPWGIFLGVLNFGTLYYFFATLEEGLLDSSQIFPIFNMCIVLIASIVGYLWFKEKLSTVNWIGIGVAIISILLLGVEF